MAIADKFNDRAALVDAIFDSMLTRAASNFPVAQSFHPQTLADEFGVSYTDKEDGYGPVFEKVFDQEWWPLIKSCSSWLASADFLIEYLSEDRMFSDTYCLSERGARLMGCLPSCLNKTFGDEQPGDRNL